MIIRSILDTDLYKFSMSYFYTRQFPSALGSFKFYDRNNEVYPPEFLEALIAEINNLSHIRLTDEERIWCTKHIPYVPEYYWEWLQSYKFDIDDLVMYLDESGHFHLETKLLPLRKVTLWEVPLLAIISELRSKFRGYTFDMKKYMSLLEEKTRLSNQQELKFSEFGTRRRFNNYLQEEVVKYLAENATYFVGTSNVYLAKKYNLVPIGTSGHECCMFIGSHFGYVHPNYELMERWADTYQGYLGIYLTDTYKTDAFLRDFTKAQAKLWDGVRHDSGDPYVYISKICKKYKELGVDPKTKTIIFSNALTMAEFADIAEACKGRIGCSAGIGTSLVSTDTGNPPANIVMKLNRSKLRPEMPERFAIKISDDEGKITGSVDEYNLAKQILQL